MRPMLQHILDADQAEVARWPTDSAWLPLLVFNVIDPIESFMIEVAARVRRVRGSSAKNVDEVLLALTTLVGESGRRSVWSKFVRIATAAEDLQAPERASQIFRLARACPADAEVLGHVHDILVDAASIDGATKRTVAERVLRAARRIVGSSRAQ